MFCDLPGQQMCVGVRRRFNQMATKRPLHKLQFNEAGVLARTWKATPCSTHSRRPNRPSCGRMNTDCPSLRLMSV